MSKDLYKYQKYKAKYLQLKQLLGGEDDSKLKDTLFNLNKKCENLTKLTNKPKDLNKDCDTIRLESIQNNRDLDRKKHVTKFLTSKEKQEINNKIAKRKKIIEKIKTKFSSYGKLIS